MPNRELEFRGINSRHLGMYFEELGGQLVTASFPFVYKGEGWAGEILEEKEISFTPVFKVNSVIVMFSAEDEEKLEELIKNYRYKTTRVGG
ncbi:hypothetical protein [Bacillus sp. T33-2]|uniref:hypothetical protein n=1 Tax=Bacillus sp. T33-2 TaxID=2054168 RepID=UPI000C761F9D|nr:hypothetical protein [Bacillus sp. T33-2]PLR96815.1 hypothetical protein CVD19_10650 [Bacillus sp. T33-2]